MDIHGAIRTEFSVKFLSIVPTRVDWWIAWSIMERVGHWVLFTIRRLLVRLRSVNWSGCLVITGRLRLVKTKTSITMGALWAVHRCMWSLMLLQASCCILYTNFKAIQVLGDIVYMIFKLFGCGGSVFACSLKAVCWELNSFIPNWVPFNSCLTCDNYSCVGLEESF